MSLCQPRLKEYSVRSRPRGLALGFDKRSSCEEETRDEALRRFVWEATVCVLVFVVCRKEEGDKATD